MEGTICKRDILAHPVVTIRSFGWKVFFRALVAGPDETFLSLLMETGTLRPSENQLATLINRCAATEFHAMLVYQTLARRFPEPKQAEEFFSTLARHEEGHGDLLRLCSLEAARLGEDAETSAVWADAVPRVERRLEEAVASLESVSSLEDALQVVVQIESSEINKVFFGVVATSDSDFVRSLGVFRVAGKMHLAYICRQLPEFQPALAAVCQELTM